MCLVQRVPRAYPEYKVLVELTASRALGVTKVKQEKLVNEERSALRACVARTVNREHRERMDIRVYLAQLDQKDPME